jgi:hypothetical protein
MSLLQSKFAVNEGLPWLLRVSTTERTKRLDSYTIPNSLCEQSLSSEL